MSERSENKAEFFNTVNANNYCENVKILSVIEKDNAFYSILIKIEQTFLSSVKH